MKNWLVSVSLTELYITGKMARGSLGQSLYNYSTCNSLTFVFISFVILQMSSMMLSIAIHSGNVGLMAAKHF
jgi:hypothetical protein